MSPLLMLKSPHNNTKGAGVTTAGGLGMPCPSASSESMINMLMETASGGLKWMLSGSKILSGRCGLALRGFNAVAAVMSWRRGWERHKNWQT